MERKQEGVVGVGSSVTSVRVYEGCVLIVH